MGAFPRVNVVGAATRNRTPDLLITSELLYLLSYGGQLTTGSGILIKAVKSDLLSFF